MAWTSAPPSGNLSDLSQNNWPWHYSMTTRYKTSTSTTSKNYSGTTALAIANDIVSFQQLETLSIKEYASPMDQSNLHLLISLWMTTSIETCLICTSFDRWLQPALRQSTSSGGTQTLHLGKTQSRLTTIRHAHQLLIVHPWTNHQHKTHGHQNATRVNCQHITPPLEALQPSLQSIIECIMGKLGHITSTAPWLRFLPTDLCTKIATCLKSITTTYT